MKTIKRLMIFSVILAMLCIFTPTTVFAEGVQGKCGNNVFWSLSDGELVIEGTGEMKIDAIDSWRSSYNKNIKSIVIKNGVTSIEEGAFKGCKNLTSVSLPNSLTSIGEYAFEDCQSLTSISIPNSVTDIGREAFGGCTHLVSVILPDSLTSIQRGVFSGCFRLASITIPDGVCQISSYAFFDCISLSSINIPNSVTRIYDKAFGLCSGLTSVTIPGSVTSIGYAAFEECKKLTSVTISNGVTSIDDRAFALCANLESISIPESVTSIGKYAFAKCKNLSKVAVYSKTAIFSESVFEDTAGYNLSLYGHKGSTTETYANTNHHKFVEIEKFDDVPISTTTPSKEPSASTVKSLTSVDYLAFSQLAYLNWETGQTVEERISKNKLIDDTSDSNITYGMLCKNILDWKVIATSENEKKYEIGFYAVTFCHEKTNQTVVAYRGSKNIAQIFDSPADVINDWLSNDIPFHVEHIYTSQLKNATDYYTYSKSLVQSKNYTLSVTGHSLGGALAETVSMTYGVYGEVFNAASVFETLYKDHPELMGERFSGVDKWNFIAHVNKDDSFVGTWQDEYQYLPFILHENTKLSSAHSLLSLLIHNKSTNEIRLSNSATTPHLTTDFTKDGWNYSPMLVFGDSGEDVFLYSSQNQEGYMYGGDGNDRLTSFKTSDDIFIGGAGTDFLTGGLGNDKYIYYKGNGVDYIYDVAGADGVEIFGLDETDVLDWYDDPAGYKVVTLKEDKNAAAIPIMYISTNRDLSKNCSFSVVADGKTVLLILGSWENFYSTFVACPVDVDILDTDGKIVMTLKNGTTMTEYTTFGNFYVFEDENGESCKRFDLVDGYTAKIRGIGEGTMDVCVLHDSINPTAATVGAEDIAVTESMTATLAFETGKPATLLVKEGAKRSEIALQKQTSITLDAGEGSCGISSVQTDFAGRVPELPTPVREGYTFSGWKKVNGTVVSAGDTLIADITLYAAWSAGGTTTTTPPIGDTTNPDVTPTEFPWWGIAIILVLVGVAVATVILLLKKRPRPDPTEW